MTFGDGTKSKISRAKMTAQLRELGVQKGGVLLVHTAFGAVKPVEDGPLGLIQALRDALSDKGTLVMPSWSADDDKPFDPLTAPSAPNLGVVADAFWRLPDVRRSDQFAAFAAVGPEAGVITADPTPLPPHIPESPVGRVHELDGQILLLGVGHSENTTLHLAELLAGVPYRTRKHFTVLKDGRPARVDYEENDCCCQRFSYADDWLRPLGLQSEGRVGHAHARLVRSRDVVALACKYLTRDLLLFLHPRIVGCAECNVAWDSVAS
jgi:aminoglycoside 3-N-acetyltransferase